MTPRSRLFKGLLILLPLILGVVMWISGRKRPRFIPLDAPAMTLAFSHDGSRLAVRTSDGTMSVWMRDVNDWLPLQAEGSDLTNPVLAMNSSMKMSFSSDDQTLFAANVQLSSSYANNGLYAWDMRSRQIKWSVVPDNKKDACYFWPSWDGKLVAQRSYRGTKVFDVTGSGNLRKSELAKSARTFPLLTRFNPGTGFPDGLAFAPDGKTVAIPTSQGALEFWDVEKGQMSPQVAATNDFHNSSGQLCYSPNGRFIASFTGGDLYVWDTVSQRWSTATVKSVSPLPSFVWMPDSHSLWTSDGSVRQWSVPDLKPLNELPVDGPIAVTGDGKILATRSTPSQGANGIWLWNIG